MKYVLWIGIVVSLLMIFIGNNPTWPLVLLSGIVANTLVVSLNEWKMPVRGLHVEGIRHTPMVPSTRLKCLGDVIPVGLGTASAGDFLVAAGVLGLWANRYKVNYAEIVVLSAFGLWVLGWSRGFNLFTKWTSEERRDARKNIPIVLILMVIGNLLSVRGCSVGEMAASVKSLRPSAVNDTEVAAKHPAPKYHDLGKLASPDNLFLKRLREEATKEEAKKPVEDAIRVTAALTGQQWFTATVTPKSARKGPFCRVTCTGCHGGEYDVETAPELCRANWIPPNAEFVPGWIAITDTQEEARPWAGPAQPGFEHYKLYWSDVRGEAKTIHPSRDGFVVAQTSTTSK